MANIALLPGGFKPPHAGHYAVAKFLSQKSGAEVLVRVGAKERDNVTQNMSIKIWNIYGVKAEPASSDSPIADVFKYVEEKATQEDTIYVGTGEKDFPRFKVLTDPSFKPENYKKYNPKGVKVIEIPIPPQAGGVSGTKMREFIKNDQKDLFQKFLPDNVDKDKIWNIVLGLNESGADTSWEDEDGNKITLEDVLDLTKNIPIKNYPTEKLAKVVLNWDDNPEEVDRISQVEISKEYPILIMVDEGGKIKWILDGNHRAQKALRAKAETIPAKLIKPSNLDAKAKKIFNLEEDLYDPNDHVLDYMKSSEWKAGMPDGHKEDDIEPGYKYRRGGMYTGGGMGAGGMYESRGGESEMHIYDFDETIARVETPIPYTVESPDGKIIEKGETTSVEFEKTKDFLKDTYDEGITINWDFKAFANLISKGTLNNEVFQKLTKSISNPDAKVTILTARAIGLPVTKFLKDQGIWAYVVPLGLNKEKGQPVTGEDKANWIEKRLKDTTKKVIFIDDAPENRKAIYALRDKYTNIEFNIEDPTAVHETKLNEFKDHELKYWALYADLVKKLDAPDAEETYARLRPELTGEKREALDYFYHTYFKEDSPENISEGAPPPGKSSAEGFDDKNLPYETEYLTLDEILSRVKGIAYYKEVLRDLQDGKDDWLVTQTVKRYSDYWMENPESLTGPDFPPIQVIGNGMKDGSHRISTLNALANHIDIDNPYWKEVKLEVRFYDPETVMASGHYYPWLWDISDKDLQQAIDDKVYNWEVLEKWLADPNAKSDLEKLNETAVFSQNWWKQQITEVLTETKANTHLTHLEELILTQGQDGFNQAKSFLYELIKNLKGESNNIKNVSVKWDGAPAIWAGINPDNAKFFVGTKSIFNVEPKINYTSQDIDENHGHAAGLAKKLKLALQYLPAVGIKGILQGDFMFDNNDVETEDIDGTPHYTFKPNTIRYAVEANSELGKQVIAARIGIIFHTTYNDLKPGSGASFGADISGLSKSPSVWFDDAYFKDDTGVLLSDQEEKFVLEKINEADSINVDYTNLPLKNLNTYLNSEIRQGEFVLDPQKSFERFKNWYQQAVDKSIEKVKRPETKEKKKQAGEDKIREFESQKENIINVFKLSKLLSEAKSIFITKYDKAVATKHFIDNGDGTLSVTKAEGFVAVDHTENGIKLVDRLEFSRNNFNAGKPGAKK